MLLNFFLYNFLPLMLLLSLTVMLIINKKLAVPATGYFYAGILLQLILTVSNTANSWAENQLLFPEQQDQQYRVLVITSVLLVGQYYLERYYGRGHDVIVVKGVPN